MRCFETALSLDPKNGSTHSALAFTHHLAGNLDVAIDTYHRALALRPDDTLSAEMLSKALEEVFAEGGSFSVLDLQESLDQAQEQHSQAQDQSSFRQGMQGMQGGEGMEGLEESGDLDLSSRSQRSMVDGSMAGSMASMDQDSPIDISLGSLASPQPPQGPQGGGARSLSAHRGGVSTRAPKSKRGVSPASGASAPQAPVGTGSFSFNRSMNGLAVSGVSGASGSEMMQLESSHDQDFDNRRRGKSGKKRHAHCIEVLLLAQSVCESLLCVGLEDSIVSTQDLHGVWYNFMLASK